MEKQHMNKQVDSIVKTLKSKGIWTTKVTYPSRDQDAVIESQNVFLTFKEVFTIAWAEQGEIGVRIFSEHNTKNAAIQAFARCIHLNKMRAGR